MKDKLRYIQQNLKAPKNQVNKFGGYNYRSCEDILEAVKPLLDEQELILQLDDELVQVGERYYVKSTARLYDGEEIIENTAYAREEETKKGMDGSQITGASSSYARKYALNGLFLIDDVKDSDTTNVGNMNDEPTEEDAKKWEFTFGKHTGKKMDDVINEDLQYVEWFIKNKANDYDKKCYEEMKERLKLMVEFQKMLSKTNTIKEKLYEYYGVKVMDEMSNEQLVDAINNMKKKIN